MNQKGFINIIIIMIVVVLAGAGAYFVLNRQLSSPSPSREITNFEECAAAGYPIMESYPEQCRAPDGRTFVRNIALRKAVFGSPIIFAVGERVELSDGLIVTLAEMNDSRCKPEVVCIWAGELSPILHITGGNAGTSLTGIRLGTVRAKSVAENGYTFTLQDASVAMATIMVTKEGVPLPMPAPDPYSRVCTQEVKQCPDGSYVRRTGNDCAFAECPAD